MRQIEITNTKLFKNLIEIEVDNVYVDLHNDYICNKVELKESNSSIEIDFIKLDVQELFNKVVFLFNDVEVIKMSLPLQKNFHNEVTIDNFYRGRFEVAGKLHEFSETGKAYYYIEFYENYVIELFASSVKAMLYKS